jgi:hypothetical protein
VDVVPHIETKKFRYREPARSHQFCEGIGPGTPAFGSRNIGWLPANKYPVYVVLLKKLIDGGEKVSFF